jgi:hypothetical protein
MGSAARAGDNENAVRQAMVIARSVGRKIFSHGGAQRGIAATKLGDFKARMIADCGLRIWESEMLAERRD